MDPKNAKLIHVATINPAKGHRRFVCLHRIDANRYVWFEEKHLSEEFETHIWGETVEEALIQANKPWKFAGFEPINCGFRYSLPERDEVGIHALFHQMVSSIRFFNWYLL